MRVISILETQFGINSLEVLDVHDPSITIGSRYSHLRRTIPYIVQQIYEAMDTDYTTQYCHKLDPQIMVRIESDLLHLSAPYTDLSTLIYQWISAVVESGEFDHHELICHKTTKRGKPSTQQTPELGGKPSTWSPDRDSTIWWIALAYIAATDPHALTNFIAEHYWQ